MSTSIVPKIKYESMEEEGQNIVNKILCKFGDFIEFIDYRKEPDRFQSTFDNSTSGWLQIVVNFKNGFGASIIWSNYSYGGDKLLWELALTKGGEIVCNEDYQDVEGYLDCVDILEHLTRISRYQNGVKYETQIW